MKNVVMAVVFLTIVQVAAQNQIQTTVLKGDQLIEYAADNFPIEQSQQLYLLVETGKSGISTESRFYIEKGIALLLKRLNERDQIAIGVYGAVDATLLPYTPIASSNTILQKVENLFEGNFTITQTDGLDLAYAHAESNQVEETLSTVVLVRGTGASGTRTITKNAYDSLTSKVGQDSGKATLETTSTTDQSRLGSAIALTALSMLPELIHIIKD